MKANIEFNGKFVYLYPTEFTDEKEAQEIINAIENYLESENRISLLVRISSYRVGVTKARLLLGEALRRRRDNIVKLAIVSDPDPLFEVAIKTIMSLGGFTNFRMFGNIDEAKNWLEF